MGIKNIKEVLSRMSEDVPGFFNTNLSSFIQLYDSENYLLRNTITEIIGNIIKLVNFFKRFLLKDLMKMIIHKLLKIRKNY